MLCSFLFPRNQHTIHKSISNTSRNAANVGTIMKSLPLFYSVQYTSDVVVPSQQYFKGFHLKRNICLKVLHPSYHNISRWAHCWKYDRPSKLTFQKYVSSVMSSQPKQCPFPPPLYLAGGFQYFTRAAPDMTQHPKNRLIFSVDLLNHLATWSKIY